MSAAKLSVLIPTFNSADQIGETLENVKWADQIVVVDSFSTDATLAICREYSVVILQHEYVNSAKQKNWAIPQCAHDWILQIDTDERVEPALRDEIRGVLADPTAGVDAYRIPFKMYILGEWVTAGDLYPQYHYRLFRKAAGRFEDKEVHAHLRVPGRIGTLREHIRHYGMPTIATQLRNLDRYSRYQADELRKRGKRFRPSQLLLRPLAVFAYYYVWKRGYRAGYRGLLTAALNATYDFYAHAKLWELDAMHLPASPKA